jgi:hypothetical protein
MASSQEVMNGVDRPMSSWPTSARADERADPIHPTVTTVRGGAEAVDRNSMKRSTSRP